MINILSRARNIRHLSLICLSTATALVLGACAVSPVMTDSAMIDPADPADTDDSDGQNQPVYQKISPDEAKTWLESADPPLLLDVRTVEENQTSRIPGGFLIPIDQLAGRIDEVPAEKNQPVIVYCRSGNRSAQAANILIDAGFTRIYDLGGIISWPFETESG